MKAKKVFTVVKTKRWDPYPGPDIDIRHDGIDINPLILSVMGIDIRELREGDEIEISAKLISRLERINVNV